MGVRQRKVRGVRDSHPSPYVWQVKTCQPKTANDVKLVKNHDNVVTFARMSQALVTRSAAGGDKARGMAGYVTLAKEYVNGRRG